MVIDMLKVKKRKAAVVVKKINFAGVEIPVSPELFGTQIEVNPIPEAEKPKVLELFQYGAPSNVCLYFIGLAAPNSVHKYFHRAIEYSDYEDIVNVTDNWISEPHVIQLFDSFVIEYYRSKLADKTYKPEFSGYITPESEVLYSDSYFSKILYQLRVATQIANDEVADMDPNHGGYNMDRIIIRPDPEASDKFISEVTTYLERSDEISCYFSEDNNYWSISLSMPEWGDQEKSRLALGVVAQHLRSKGFNSFTRGKDD